MKDKFNRFQSRAKKIPLYELYNPLSAFVYIIALVLHLVGWYTLSGAVLMLPAIIYGGSMRKLDAIEEEEDNGSPNGGDDAMG